MQEFHNLQEPSEMPESNTNLENTFDNQEEEDLSDFQEWDRFDVTVNEFVNVRKSESYPLSCYKILPKIFTKQNNKNKTAQQKFDLQGGGSKEINERVSALSKVEKNEIHCKKITKKKEGVCTNFDIDHRTESVLSKLLKKKLLKQINGIIRVGREAAAFHVNSYKSYRGRKIPPECVIKVFKVDISTFPERVKYLLSDFRVDQVVTNTKTKKVIHLLAQKEKLNLVRLKKAGVPCPDFVALQEHVVVMSFIGKDYQPALKLKYASLTDAEYERAYQQVVDGMINMYQKARLIHTDLTEYNILWHNNSCYFIDFSQSVEPCHLDCYFFLMEDCTNMFNFFKAKGVPNILAPEELFMEITGYWFGDRIQLVAAVEDYNRKWHPSHKKKSKYLRDNKN